MKLTIVYDNNSMEGLRRGHGFSCLLENKKKILIDTGWDGHLLLYNMNKLGIDPLEIDTIFLSHNHWDHIGGLPTILNLNKNLEVFCLKSFSDNLKAEIKVRARLREISTTTKIMDGIHTTGELGKDIKEQALAVESERGIVVITGCSHPGLALILDKSLRFGDVYGIVGGLHGFSEYSILEGIQVMVPCHCTRNKKEIRERYPKNYEVGFAGKIIEF